MRFILPGVGYMLNAAGAPQIGLGISLVSAGTLLTAEPLLVKATGLEGAVLALVDSNAAGTLFGLAFQVTGRAPVRLDLHNLRLDFRITSHPRDTDRKPCFLSPNTWFITINRV